DRTHLAFLPLSAIGVCRIRKAVALQPLCRRWLTGVFVLLIVLWLVRLIGFLGRRTDDHGWQSEAGDLSAILDDGAAAKHAAGARQAAADGGGREIVGHAFFLLVGRDVQQPQKQEEGHHRGHEVGIGDFPRAAVMRMFALLDLLDDDWAFALCRGHGSARFRDQTDWTLLVASSTS